MGVMMLAAGRGTSLEIIADGTDEEDAIRLLDDLTKMRFGEEE